MQLIEQTKKLNMCGLSPFFSIIRNLKIFISKFSRSLPIALLCPVLPFLGWGPLTHAFINRKALEFLDEMGGIKEPSSANALKNADSKKLFLVTAAWPDIIKSKGFLKGDMSYDYAHNPLPNRFYGNPSFSIDLLNRAIKEQNDEEIILALSWRAHQVADVFAHHVPLNGSWGYVNSKNFFGPFWPEVFEHLKGQDPGELPGTFYRADHWISELIIDLFCYLKNSSIWMKEIFFALPRKHLRTISEVSKNYLNINKETLLKEYETIAPIEIHEIKRGMEFSEALNAATFRYFDSLIHRRSKETIERMIANHGKFGTLNGMLDLVAYETARSLLDPLGDWKAPKINSQIFLDGSASFNDVFPGYISDSEKKYYYSEKLEDQWRNYKPKREGIVKLVLEKTPLPAVKWIVLNTSLVTGSGWVNRTIFPKGKTSYALSLRYAFKIRESKLENLMTILRRTLEDADIIDSQR